MRKRAILVVVLSVLGGCVSASAAELIQSHLGNRGPSYKAGTTPRTLGWGPDDRAYPDRMVVGPKDGSEMVWVPAGKFMMGSQDGQGHDDEHPRHEVVLRGYWIDRTEVTNEQYAKFLTWIKQSGDHAKCFTGEPKNGPHKDHTPMLWAEAKWNRPRQPVVGVDWFDAYAYAAWAGKRLPTGSEWEKAARGIDGRVYPWGDLWDSSRCNSDETGEPVTVVVGSYPEGESPHGCLDMAGNVQEWCSDCYASDYYRSSPKNNPTGPTGNNSRLLRGGSWWDVAVGCRSACRVEGGFIPIFRSGYAGFRCVRPQ
ncbi:MAG: formylglycine-generating enzyme family protein [Armatimonadota bacterium]